MIVKHRFERFIMTLLRNKQKNGFIYNWFRKAISVAVKYRLS